MTPTRRARSARDSHAGPPLTRVLGLVLTAALAAWLAVFGVPLQHPQLGLDPSWQQALVEATDRGWIFGRDLVFSYGPLHQLATAQISSNLLPLLLGRLIVGLAWGAAAALVGWLGGLATALTLVIWIAIIPTGVPVGADALHLQLCSLGVLVAFAARRWSDRRAGMQTSRLLMRGLLTMQMCGIAIGILVKLSYIGASIPALLAMAWLQLSEQGSRACGSARPARWLLRGIPSLTVILTVLLTWRLTVSADPSTLGSYLSGGNLEMVRGYSEAMSFDLAAANLPLTAAFGLACGLASWLLWFWMGDGPDRLSAGRARECRGGWVTGLALCCIALVGFKASFVREDLDHTAIGWLSVVGFISVLGVWISRDHWRDWQRFVPHGRRILLLALLAFAAMIRIQGLQLRLSPASAAELWRWPQLLFHPEQRHRLGEQRRQALQQLRSQAEDFAIPPGASADILNVEISALLSNGVRYQPRPVPQSYAAYTPRLQQANADHFAQPDSQPQFVVVSLSEIDDRLPISLDSPALRQILRHYRFSHRGSRGALVFRLRPTSRAGREASRMPDPIQHQALGQHPIQQHIPARHPRPGETHGAGLPSGELRWHRQGRLWRYQSDAIPLPAQAAPLYLNSQFENSLQRALLTAIYRSASVWIDYLDRRGVVVQRYRFIPQAGRQMLIWPLIRTNDDLARSLNGTGVLGGSGRAGAPDRATAIRFVTDSIGPPFRSSRFQLAR